MKLVSILWRCAVIVAAALICGELYARFGSRDRGEVLLQTIGDASAERGRLGALPVGPARAGAPSWFDEEPPALGLATASTATTFPHLDARAADQAILSITGLNFPRVYNHAFVTRSVCDNPGDSFFDALPHELYVFDPRHGEVDPSFRFYPNARYPSGLRTNSLGYRSPEIVAARPGNVVRVAFVGASTVLGHPRAQLNSPDYLAYWLTKWASSNRMDVQFDYVNAAREGISAGQVAEIIRHEVALLKPDIVIYWGFESFDLHGFVKTPPGVAFGHPVKRPWDDLAASASLAGSIARRSALLRLIRASLDDPFDRAGTAREPAKPAYERRFPADFSATEPRLNPDVPSEVRAVYTQLDQVVAAVRSIGAVPILVANQYAAYDGALIAADRSTRDPLLNEIFGGVYGYLNGGRMWPLTYADQRAILEYQARLFRGFARERQVTFVDLLTDRKLDTALFLDGVHLTPLGMKLTAWWMFQELLPAIEAYVRAPRLRDMRVSGEDIAYLTQTPRRLTVPDVDCEPPGPADEIAGAYPLAMISLAYEKARLVKGAVPLIRTAESPSTYAAKIPIQPPPGNGLSGRGWVAVRIKVIEGSVSVGLLDKTAQRFLGSFRIKAGPNVRTGYIAIENLAELGEVMISNARPDQNAASRAELHGVVLKRFR